MRRAQTGEMRSTGGTEIIGADSSSVCRDIRRRRPSPLSTAWRAARVRGSVHIDLECALEWCARAATVPARRSETWSTSRCDARRAASPSPEISGRRRAQRRGCEDRSGTSHETRARRSPRERMRGLTVPADGEELAAAFDSDGRSSATPPPAVSAMPPRHNTRGCVREEVLPCDPGSRGASERVTGSLSIARRPRFGKRPRI